MGQETASRPEKSEAPAGCRAAVLPQTFPFCPREENLVADSHAGTAYCKPFGVSLRMKLEMHLRTGLTPGESRTMIQGRSNNLGRHIKT